MKSIKKKEVIQKQSLLTKWSITTGHRDEWWEWGRAFLIKKQSIQFQKGIQWNLEGYHWSRAPSNLQVQNENNIHMTESSTHSIEALRYGIKVMIWKIKKLSE